MIIAPQRYNINPYTEEYDRDVLKGIRKAKSIKAFYGTTSLRGRLTKNKNLLNRINKSIRTMDKQIRRLPKNSEAYRKVEKRLKNLKIFKQMLPKTEVFINKIYKEKIEDKNRFLLEEENITKNLLDYFENRDEKRLRDFLNLFYRDFVNLQTGEPVLEKWKAISFMYILDLLGLNKPELLIEIISEDGITKIINYINELKPVTMYDKINMEKIVKDLSEKAEIIKKVKIHDNKIYKEDHEEFEKLKEEVKNIINIKPVRQEDLEKMQKYLEDKIGKRVDKETLKNGTQIILDTESNTDTGVYLLKSKIDIIRNEFKKYSFYDENITDDELIEKIIDHLKEGRVKEKALKSYVYWNINYSGEKKVYEGFNSFINFKKTEFPIVNIFVYNALLRVLGLEPLIDLTKKNYLYSGSSQRNVEAELDKKYNNLYKVYPKLPNTLI